MSQAIAHWSDHVVVLNVNDKAGRIVDEIVAPSASFLRYRNDRAVSIESVCCRSPTISDGITYIDTASENTKAHPATTPGRLRGSVT